MPVDDVELIDEPIDGEGEVAALDVQNLERVTWSIKRVDDFVGVRVEIRQKGGEWFNRAEYPVSKNDREDDLRVTASETRLYIFEAAEAGSTADFYFAVGSA